MLERPPPVRPVWEKRRLAQVDAEGAALRIVQPAQAAAFDRIEILDEDQFLALAQTISSSG